MSEDSNSPFTYQTTWRLLAQFILPAETAAGTHVMALTGEALRGMRLPAAQLQRIQAAVADAARQASEHTDRRHAALPLSITVLVSGPGRRVAEPPDPTNHPVSQPRRPSWGFFLVHRLDEGNPVPDVEVHQRFELFLYPEGETPAAEAT